MGSRARRTTVGFGSSCEGDSSLTSGLRLDRSGSRTCDTTLRTSRGNALNVGASLGRRFRRCIRRCHPGGMRTVVGKSDNRIQSVHSTVFSKFVTRGFRGCSPRLTTTGSGDHFGRPMRAVAKVSLGNRCRGNSRKLRALIGCSRSDGLAKVESACLSRDSALFGKRALKRGERSSRNGHRRLNNGIIGRVPARPRPAFPPRMPGSRRGPPVGLGSVRLPGAVAPFWARGGKTFLGPRSVCWGQFGLVGPLFGRGLYSIGLLMVGGGRASGRGYVAARDPVEDGVFGFIVREIVE